MPFGSCGRVWERHEPGFDRHARPDRRVCDRFYQVLRRELVRVWRHLDDGTHLGDGRSFRERIGVRPEDLYRRLGRTPVDLRGLPDDAVAPELRDGRRRILLFGARRLRWWS